MQYNVNRNNVWALRALLQQQYEAEIAKLKDEKGFTWDFSKEKPYFEMTLRVDLMDFTVKVNEAELSKLKGQLEQAQQEIRRLLNAETTETLVEFGDEVIAHQKRGGFHRLVLCNRPLPQEKTEWKPRGETVTLGQFFAAWDNVEKCPF